MNVKHLIQWPIEEIERLRTKQVCFHGKKLPGGSLLEVPGITASQVPLVLWFNSFFYYHSSISFVLTVTSILITFYKC